MSRDPDLANEIMDEARRLAELYGIEIRLPGRFHRPSNPARVSPVDPTIAEPERRRDKTHFTLPIAEREERRHCLYPWHYVIITRYGDVLPCGGWWEKPYGNIFREPFEDVWNNEGYRVLRGEHVSGRLGKTCQTCPATMMGNVDSDSAFSVRTSQ